MKLHNIIILMNSNIPNSFLCCITHNIMKNPVMDNEGNTYEKDAILKWLENNTTSPITRNILTINDLKPNRALKDAIETFLKGYNKETIKTKTSHNYDYSDNKITGYIKDNLLMINIDNPEGIDRHSVDIVLLIDASGSMSTIASIKNEKGESENHGLTLLDIVKHGAKTIVSCLSENDRICIISYSDNSIIEFPLNYMNDENKKLAIESIENINTRGCTNIWCGLEESLKILYNNKIDSNNKSVFLLTDGMPNISPPRGHIKMLERFQDKYPDCGKIFTYGFGYDVDSELLSNLAKYSGGNYYMIPDSSFLGTIFEHSFSNLVTSYTDNLIIKLEYDDNNIKNTFNTYLTKKESSYYSIIYGPLQYGQTKNFIIEFEKPITDNTEIFIEYYDYRFKKIIKKNLIAKNTNELSILNDFSKHYLRCKMNNIFNDCMNNIDNSYSIIEEYLNDLTLFIKEFNDNYINDLIIDIAGEVKLAFNKNAYDRWGKHYLLSLMNAHLNQQCNNFKDPGVQHFGGKLFQKIRDMSDDIFVSLPPPKPSNTFRSNIPSINTMRMYSNSNTPCFHGDCITVLESGKITKLKELKKGDRIITSNCKIGTIKCIVKTLIPSGKLPMIEINGLLVTEWHPIKINNIWCFPKTRGNLKLVDCKYIYSFLLESNDEPIMKINGIDCVTLAHNLKGNIVEHPYYGTNKIIDDLKKIDGFEDGLVILKNRLFIRDRTNKVFRIE